MTTLVKEKFAAAREQAFRYEEDYEAVELLDAMTSHALVYDKITALEAGEDMDVWEMEYLDREIEYTQARVREAVKAVDLSSLPAIVDLMRLIPGWYGVK